MSRWSFRPPRSLEPVAVRVERGLLRRGGALGALPRARRGVLIHDAALAPHLGALEALVAEQVDEVAPPLALVATEATKEVERLPELWRALQARDLDRRDVVIAAGGGITLDVAVFLAATWLRGLTLVVVPTTLLAQVDAGLGGKCGVNLGGAKNQVGAVYQPACVLVDPDLLATLPEDAWRSGLGEVAKTAALAGGPLWKDVEAFAAAPSPEHLGIDQIVEGCLRFKAGVVTEDETERGRRAILNLGHTVGHVLESLAAAQATEIPHGIAVAAGLVAETAWLARKPELAARLATVLQALGLPIQLSLEADPETTGALLRRDKKRRGDRWLVPLLRDFGDVTLEERDAPTILTAIAAAIA